MKAHDRVFSAPLRARYAAPRLPWLGVLLLTLLSGCAFEDGQPWGELTVTMQASAPTSLRTAEGVTVRLDAVTLTVERLALFGADDPAAAFDPADPPEGCTLCHGGHCHCGDALVSYGDLAAAAASGGAATPILTLDAPAAPIALAEERTTVPLVGCTTDCPMSRGAVTRAELRITGLSVSGRSADGVTFEGELPLALAFDTVVDLAFDRDAPVAGRLDLVFSVPPSLFDGVTWPADGMLDLTATAEAIRDNLATDAGWAVDADR